MSDHVEVKNPRSLSSFRVCIYIILAGFMVLIWHWRQEHERAHRERHDRQSAAPDIR